MGTKYKDVRLAQKFDQIEHEFWRKRAEKAAAAAAAAAEKAHRSRLRKVTTKMMTAKRLLQASPEKKSSLSKLEEQASPSRKPNDKSAGRKSTDRPDAMKSILRSPSPSNTSKGSCHPPASPIKESVMCNSTVNKSALNSNARRKPQEESVMMDSAWSVGSLRLKSDRSKLNSSSTSCLHQAHNSQVEMAHTGSPFMTRPASAQSKGSRPASAQTRLSRPASAQSRMSRPASAQSKAVSNLSGVSSISVDYGGSNASTMAELEVGFRSVGGLAKRGFNDKLVRSSSVPAVEQLPAGRESPHSSCDIRCQEGETARMIRQQNVRLARQIWKKSGSVGTRSEFEKLLATL